MNALSLIEPWASLVAWGYKKIETRSWYTPYRGVIAIHASKSKEAIKDPEDVDFLFDEAGLATPDWWPDEPTKYPLGKVVAVVRLLDCKRMTADLIAKTSEQEVAFGAWQEGRFAWYLGEARRIEEAIPCRGALGLWDLPAEVEAQAMARCV